MIDARRAIVVATLMLPLAPASADTATDQELRNLIEQQEQRIKVLERKLEIQDENAKATVAATPVVKASPKGMSFQSADGSNLIKFRGLLHVDGATFLDDADLKGINGWSLNRVRPILEGTFGGMYDWRFTPDFGRGKTVIQDAYVTGRFDPRFALTAGKFRRRSGSSACSCQRHPLRAARVSDQPRPEPRHRHQASGSLLPDRVEYQVAYLNGSNDGGSSGPSRRRIPIRTAARTGRCASSRRPSRTRVCSDCAASVSASPAPRLNRRATRTTHCFRASSRRVSRPSSSTAVASSPTAIVSASRRSSTTIAAASA
jgi:hypothetical protein